MSDSVIPTYAGVKHLLQHVHNLKRDTVILQDADVTSANFGKMNGTLIDYRIKQPYRVILGN